MKTGFLITARLKSTRLPRKVLLDLDGRPVLAHVIERARSCPDVAVVAVCTSTHPDDDELALQAQRLGARCFRGSEDDVLQRLSAASDELALEYVLNITADCPLVDPVYAGRIVSAYQETGADLITALDLPHGAYCYGVKPAALRKALEVKADGHTEVWGRYFTDTDAFRVHRLQVEPKHRRPELRLTLDYPEDHEMLSRLLAALGRPGKIAPLEEVISLLDRRPELRELNKARAVDYQERWQRQSQIQLRPRHAIRRAAIVGCGSIGLRHLSVLRGLGITELAALRSGHGLQTRQSGERLQEMSRVEDLVAWEPDVAFVTNPTSLHVDTALALAPFVKGLFIEKPLAASGDRLEELLAVVERERTVTFVGYNLDFHPALLRARELVDSGRLGKPLILQALVGQWLPDWRPGGDYRRHYFARAELGGGALPTLVHELRLARVLLGPVRELFAALAPWPGLDVDVEAVADIQMRHASGAVSQVHLDFVQAPLMRRGVVGCQHGSLSYDLLKPSLEVMCGPAGDPGSSWSGGPSAMDDTYVDEVEAFLRCVREGRVRHERDVWSAAHEVAILDAARRSAETGVAVSLPAVAA